MTLFRRRILWQYLAAPCSPRPLCFTADYSCVWELFCLQFEVCHVQFELFLLTVELLCLQWESVSKKHPNGLKQRSSTVSKKARTVRNKASLVHVSPFTGEWFNYFLFIQGLFAAARRLAFVHSHLHLPITGECSLIHSIHANKFTPFTRIVATKCRTNLTGSYLFSPVVEHWNLS